MSGETRGLARDSLPLAVGKGAATAGMVTQVALITHMLGLHAYGVFALAVSFVALVNKFFDVSVGRVVITFGARTLPESLRRTAGVCQFGYLVDFMLGVVGFAVVAAVAPFVGPRLVGDDGALLVLLYGLTLLASTVDTTSGSLLQLLGRYGTLAQLTVVREAARVGLVVAALVVFDSLIAVMVALVVTDALTGGVGVTLAGRAFAARGGSLWQPAIADARDLRRPMLGMIFHTNLIAYGRLAQAQGPVLLLGAFTGPFEVGVFKIGMAGAAAIGQIYTPASHAVLPRLAHLWTASRIEAARRLVAQATVISAVALVSAGLLAILLREPLLRLFGGGEATQATLVFSLCVLAQVVNGSVFWNDSVLFAARRPALVTKIYLPSVLVMLALVVVLGRDRGAEGVAIAVLATAVLNNVGLTAAALAVLSRSRAAGVSGDAPAVEVAVDVLAERGDVVAEPAFELAPDGLGDLRTDELRVGQPSTRPLEAARDREREPIPARDPHD